MSKTPDPPELERPRAINNAMVRLFTTGIPDEILKTATLAEMVAASPTIAAWEETQKKEIHGGFSKPFHMSVDDRGVAAIYTMLHYEPVDPEPSDGEIEPVMAWQDRALILVEQKQSADVDGDDDQE